MWNHLDLDIHYFVRRKTFLGWSILPRKIADHELVYILQGEGNISLAGVIYQVKSGDLVYIQPGVEHWLNVSAEPCMEFYAVHMGLPANVHRLPLPDIWSSKPPQLDSLFRKLELAVRHNTYLSTWQQNLVLEQIVCECLQLLQTDQLSYHTVRINRVLDLIHDNPCLPLTMDDLLVRAGLQKSAFLQSFKAVTGTTPRQYILKLRLQHACDLLSETDLPISQIAEQSGFSDSFYFSRCFRQWYGLPPIQWRRNAKQTISYPHA